MLLWALKYGNLLILQKKPMYLVHILIKSVPMPRNTAHGYSERSVQETKLLHSHCGKLLYSLDYCSQLWSPHKINEIEKLESIAKSFTCRMSEAMHLDYWERLSHLGLMSQQRQRERYHEIIYVWKVLEGLSNSCLTANPIISYTNPQRGRLCFMPHMTRMRQFLTTVRHNNISSLGRRLFNIIPQDIRNLTNCGLELFKRKLDEFLLQLPDQPHVSEYPRQYNNSLSDVITAYQRTQGGAFGLA